MKIIVVLNLSMLLVSCGLNVELGGIELQSNASLIDSSYLSGTQVGDIKINNVCSRHGFTIINDTPNIFDIDVNGVITLATDNPSPGTYELRILAACDDKERNVTITIVVNQYLPNIPIIPWARQIGTTTETNLSLNAASYDECYRSAVDILGNVYCAGRTNGSLAEANAGGYDALIMKFDPSGNNIWIRQMGSISAAILGANASGNDRCLGIAVDSSGNVYCGGGSTGSFGEAGAGNEDILIIKLDSDGNPLWARQVGSATATLLGGSAGGTDRCFNVQVDNSDNVYCGGGAQSSITDTHAGGDDAFVVKYNSLGVVQWLTQYGSSVVTGFGNEQCAAIAFDSSDNIICTGSTQAQLGEAGAGGRDAWVSKIDSDGNNIWIRQLGSVSAAALSVNAAADDLCWGVAVDSSDNIYCAGQTSGSLGEANAGGNDLFWMQLDSSGVINWVRQLGSVTAPTVSANASGSDICERLGIDVFDNLYCGGRTTGALGEANGGLNDIFTMKFDSSGAITWISQLGSVSSALLGGNASGDDLCFGISVDPLGNSYCAGRTTGGLFEPNAGSNDVVLIKTNPSGDIQ